MNEFNNIEDFPHRTYDKLRYGDTDRQGHINNANFATFFETGRVEFLYKADDPIFDKGMSFVIAALNIDFKNEITWPGRVEIGTGVTRIGTSSVSMIQALYQNDILVATATSVIVQIDNESKKSAPLSEIAKEKLEGYVVINRGEK